MTVAQQIARFAISKTDGDLSDESKTLFKRNVLDTIGCAIGALDAGPIVTFKRLVEEFGGNELCTMIGGGKTAPDRAAINIATKCDALILYISTFKRTHVTLQQLRKVNYHLNAELFTQLHKFILMFRHRR
jgi:hypothetical protein